MLATGVEYLVPAGVYQMAPFTLLDINYVNIRGLGRAVFLFTTGTAGITIGDAAHLHPCRRLTFTNIEITASAALTYGIQCLYAVDCTGCNLRILDTGTFITNGLYLDYSWDNQFYGTIILALNGVVFGTSAANKNSFFGGRIESTNNATGVGVTANGAGNLFSGCDVSSTNYGYLIRGVAGFTVQGCYFEASKTNDIFFDGTIPATGVSITGNFFDERTYTTNSISAPLSGNAASGVSIYGNCFYGPPATGFIVLNANAFSWNIGGNHYFGSGLYTVGVGSMCQVQTFGKYTTGHLTNYQKIPAQTSGTLIIDAVTNITPNGTPAHVTLRALTQTGSNDFEAIAIISDTGTLVTSQIVKNTAGIGVVQISGGNLQVTTANLGNYIFNIDVCSFATTV